MYTYDEVTRHCDTFFDRPSDQWSYEDFASHFASLGAFKFDVLNHKWVKALGVIESSPTETRARRRKARSLIDRLKNVSHQRRTRSRALPSAAPARSTIVHGDIVHNGDIVQQGGVKIGVAGGDIVVTGGGEAAISTATSKKRTAETAATSLPKRRTRSNVVDAGQDVIDAGNAVTVLDDAPSSSSATLSPRYSPAPPFGEDPYSDFGEFPYSTMFITTYFSMLPASKRSFETGKILEDTIFHNVRPTPPGSKWLKGNPILRWIIDIDDIEVKKWFTKAERMEFKSWGPPLPPRDPAFEYAVGRFPKIPTSFEELWDITESRSRPVNEPFVEASHCTAIYSNNAANSILAMIRSYNTCPWLGPQDLREGWFAGIWQPLIDRCLHCIPSLSVFRTEIKSSSSTAKSRLDAILRAQLADATVYELGCIEVARVTAATPAGKEEVDAGKLVCALQDMLYVLERSVHGDEDVMRRVQVVGIQNVGFRMNVYMMHMLGRHVAVLQRGVDWCVPMQLGEFRKVIEVMRAVVRVKGIVERGIEAVREWEERRRGEEDVL